MRRIEELEMSFSMSFGFEFRGIGISFARRGIDIGIG
jgi:hypothetical protein